MDRAPRLLPPSLVAVEEEEGRAGWAAFMVPYDLAINWSLLDGGQKERRRGKGENEG